MFVSSVMYVIPLAVYSIVLGLEDNAYDNRQYNTLYNRQSDGETIISGESRKYFVFLFSCHYSIRALCRALNK